MRDFDKSFERTEKAVGCLFISILLINVVILVFIGFVIIKVLQYFGVI